MKTVNSRKVYTVSEINYFAKETLEQLTAWVEGEISTYQTNPNWFYAFFTIKEETDNLSCFIEPSKIEGLEHFQIGKRVLVYGMLTLFKKSEYKLKVLQIEEAGEGILEKQFKQLYEKLKKEGLFESKYKKKLPPYPKKLCVITSENSAGWNDFVRHTAEKFPVIELTTINVKVEGTQATQQLLAALGSIDAKNYDIVVITRGGGAKESLDSTFNDEQVVRAVFNLETPTVVAVGHEINTTLAELAADVRASTPTDAAAIITASWQTVLEKLNAIYKMLVAKKEKQIDFNIERLDYSYSRLLNVKNSFSHYQEKLENIDHALNILSVQNTLNRGYSIATDKSNKILRSASSVGVGNLIRVKLARGSLVSNVTNVKND